MLANITESGYCLCGIVMYTLIGIDFTDVGADEAETGGADIHQSLQVE